MSTWLTTLCARLCVAKNKYCVIDARYKTKERLTKPTWKSRPSIKSDQINTKAIPVRLTLLIPLKSAYTLHAVINISLNWICGTICRLNIVIFTASPAGETKSAGGGQSQRPYSWWMRIFAFEYVTPKKQQFNMFNPLVAYFWWSMNLAIYSPVKYWEKNTTKVVSFDFERIENSRSFEKETNPSGPSLHSIFWPVQHWIQFPSIFRR